MPYDHPSGNQDSNTLARKKKILVVDDDPELIQSLCRWFRSNNYDCITLLESKEALARVKHHLPDLILLDLNMPGLSGLDLLTLFKADAQIKGIPVVVLTAFSGEDLARHAMDLGASAYVVKTHLMEDLMPLISGYLNG